MSSAVVIDAIRTPIARADARVGWFRDVRSDELSAGLISELVNRTGIDLGLGDVQPGLGPFDALLDSAH